MGNLSIVLFTFISLDFSVLVNKIVPDTPSQTLPIRILPIQLWDVSWQKLLKNNGILIYLYFRYVDDNRTFLPPLADGVVWVDGKFKYSEAQEKVDKENMVSDQSRTTRELVKAMSSSVEFLKFEGEDCEMFSDHTLPTLDTFCEVQILRKTNCPKQGNPERDSLTRGRS